MSAFELFQSYRRGWIDAAKSARRDPRFIEHKTRPDLTAEYERGYAEGRLDVGRAMTEACKRIGYTPNHLRVTP